MVLQLTTSSIRACGFIMNVIVSKSVGRFFVKIQSSQKVQILTKIDVG